jgi:hypothetical protein
MDVKWKMLPGKINANSPRNNLSVGALLASLPLLVLL